MNTPEIAYGYHQNIPIEQVIARTKVRLQIKDVADYDDEIAMFINEGLSSLGTKFNFIKKNCKIEIINGRGKLPRNLTKLLGVRMVVEQVNNASDTNNANIFTTISPFWDEMLYLSRTFLEDCKNEPGLIPNRINVAEFLPSMEIVGGYIRFPIPTPFTHAIISYMGYATTQDCIMEIKAAYERGISEYAYSMMLQSYPQLWLPEWGNRENAIERALNTWVAQRAKIVSDGFAEDLQLNKYTVKRMLNALLQQQNYVSAKD